MSTPISQHLKHQIFKKAPLSPGSPGRPTAPRSPLLKRPGVGSTSLASTRRLGGSRAAFWEEEGNRRKKTKKKQKQRNQRNQTEKEMKQQKKEVFWQPLQPEIPNELNITCSFFCQKHVSVPFSPKQTKTSLRQTKQQPCVFGP